MRIDGKLSVKALDTENVEIAVGNEENHLAMNCNAVDLVHLITKAIREKQELTKPKFK